MLFNRLESVAAADGFNAFKPLFQGFRGFYQPGCCSVLGIFAIIQNRSHDFVFHGQGSEAGMLSQVARATRGEDWIVFLGWEPHPMNANHDITYLSGGDDWFGPNYGGATVYTNVRAGGKFSTKMHNQARHTTFAHQQI